MIEDNNKKVSKYHDAFNEIIRINYDWQESKRLLTSGNYDAARWKLDDLWIELSGDDKEGKYKKIIGLLDKKINTCFSRGDIDDLYRWLRKKQHVLKKLQIESGKGGQYTDEDDEGF